MLGLGQIVFKSIRHLRYYVGRSLSEMGLGKFLYIWFILNYYLS